ncbi:MAG: hypothetical protein AAB531_03345 [Patescibacteria group bacterium]
MTSLSIKLENGFSPKVKAGDKVAVGQLLAEKSIKGTDHEIHIAKLLDVPPQISSKFVIKRPGDRVGQGTIVAVKKGALGMGGKKAVSPIEGTVFKFENETGILTIRSSTESQIENLFSPVDGEVAVCDNEKITIKTQKGVIAASVVLGVGSFEAELYVVKGDEVSSADLKSDLKGKVVVGKSLDREVIAKSLGLGAKGVIGGNINEEDIADLKARMTKTPIFVVSDEDIEKIIKSDGKKIYLETEKRTLILQ